MTVSSTNGEFTVHRADGSQVMIGDRITSVGARRETTTFRGCKHPRKIMTTEMGCERYPSVYDLEIRNMTDGYVWNPVSDEGRRMWEARPW